MSECPKCNEEIKYLKAYSEVVHNFEIDKQGNPFCFGSDHVEGYSGGFECPECKEELFNGFEEIKAVKFLKGESRK